MKTARQLATTHDKKINPLIHRDQNIVVRVHSGMDQNILEVGHGTQKQKQSLARSVNREHLHTQNIFIFSFVARGKTKYTLT
jgi:hypothetical protein